MTTRASAFTTGCLTIAMLSSLAVEVADAQRGESPETTEITKWPSLSEKIGRLYAEYDQPHTPGGVAAVIYRGEVVHLKGYGSANRELDVRWTPDTRYRIASVTKSFVAYAVLLLEQRGLLRLDDPIQKHLPDFPVFDSPVRLHHLLSMTSGLWQDETLLSLTSLRGRVTLDEMYALSKRQNRLNYAPGSAASYVDTNFRLLARVITAVTDLSFWEAMDELIFEPLGMESTLAAPDFSRYFDGQAPTYVESAHGASRILSLPFPTSGDGSIITTMRDMTRWLRHLRSADGTPIFRHMIEPFRLADGSAAHYRRGIIRVYHRNLVGWGHGGSTGTHYIVWPELDLIVANFTNNLDQITPILMTVGITDRVLEVKPEIASSVAADNGFDALPRFEALTPRDVELLSGTFVDTNSGYVLTSEPQGDRLAHSFLGSSTVLGKLASGHYVSHLFAWQSPIEVRIATGGGQGLPDLLVQHADWDRPRRFTRVLPMTPSDIRPEHYTGHYYSPVLGVHYSVEQRAGNLVLRIGAGIQAGQVLKLQPLTSECFLARPLRSEGVDFFDLGTLTIRFSMSPEGETTGMRVSIEKIRDVDFRRQ